MSGFIDADDVILDDTADATVEVDLAAFRRQNDDGDDDHWHRNVQPSTSVALEPIADLIAGLPGDNFVRPTADAFAKLMVEALSAGVFPTDDAPTLFRRGAYHALPMRVTANSPVMEEPILHLLSSLSTKQTLDHAQRQRAVYKQVAPFVRKTGKPPIRDVTFQNDAVGGRAMVALGANQHYDGDPIQPSGLVPLQRNTSDVFIDPDHVFDPAEYLRELHELRMGSNVTAVFNVPVAFKGAMTSHVEGTVVGKDDAFIMVKLDMALKVSPCDSECKTSTIRQIKVPLHEYNGVLLYPRERRMKPDKLTILSNFRVVLSDAHPAPLALMYALPRNSDEWLTVAVRSMGRRPRSIQEVERHLYKTWGVQLKRMGYNWASRQREDPGVSSSGVDASLEAREPIGVERYMATFQVQSVSASKQKAPLLQHPSIISVGSVNKSPPTDRIVTYGIVLLKRDSGKVDMEFVWDDALGKVVSVTEYLAARTRRLQGYALSVAEDVEYLKNAAAVGAATVAVRERLEESMRVRRNVWDFPRQQMTYSLEVRRLTRYSGDIFSDDPDIGDGAFIVTDDADMKHVINGLGDGEEGGSLNSYVVRYLTALGARAPGSGNGDEKVTTVSSFFVERIVRAKCAQMLSGAVAGLGAATTKPLEFWLSPAVYGLMIRAGFLPDDVMRELETVASYIVPATIKLLVSLNELVIGSVSSTKDALKAIDEFVSRSGSFSAYKETFRYMLSSQNIVKGLITRTATFMRFVTEFDDRPYAAPRAASGVRDPGAPKLAMLRRVTGEDGDDVAESEQHRASISHANTVMVSASTFSIPTSDAAKLVRVFLDNNKQLLNTGALPQNIARLNVQVDAAFKQSKLDTNLRQNMYRRASLNPAELRSALCRFLRKVLQMQRVDALLDMSAELGVAVAMYTIATFKDYKTIEEKLPAALHEYDTLSNREAIDTRFLEMRGMRGIQLRKTAELAGIDAVDAKLYENLIGNEDDKVVSETLDDDDVDVVIRVGVEDDDDRDMRVESD